MRSGDNPSVSNANWVWSLSGAFLVSLMKTRESAKRLLVKRSKIRSLSSSFLGVDLKASFQLGYISFCMSDTLFTLKTRIRDTSWTIYTYT